MNIDREKLIKSGAILVGLFIAVGTLTQIARKGSMTLSDYEALHPEFAASESSEDAEETIDITTEETSADVLDENQMNLTENLQNEASVAPASTLSGALLNGESMLEERVEYADFFYYEPLSDGLQRYITGVSYPAVDAEDSGEELAISYEELRYLHLLHYDFEGNVVEGELICSRTIAQDLVEIFYELYENEYRLEKVLLIDEYNGDDNASMEDNNTSCFNYRPVTGDTNTHLSKHALGCAIDINPLYNPYITYEADGSANILPASATGYTDRSRNFPYKIDENDLCYKLFKAHGFTWGGDWNSCKDYQHFQKVPK